MAYTGLSSPPATSAVTYTTRCPFFRSMTWGTISSWTSTTSATGTIAPVADGTYRPSSRSRPERASSAKRTLTGSGVRDSGTERWVTAPPPTARVRSRTTRARSTPLRAARSGSTSKRSSVWGS